MTRKMANYNQVKVLTDSICEKLNITDEDEIQDAYVVAMECIKNTRITAIYIQRK